MPGELSLTPLSNCAIGTVGPEHGIDTRIVGRNSNYEINKREIKPLHPGSGGQGGLVTA